MEEARLFITYRGWSTFGEVVSATSDGVHMVLRCEAHLGPFEAGIPVRWSGESYRNPVDGQLVGILEAIPVLNTGRGPRVWVHRQLSPVTENGPCEEEAW